MLMQRGVANLNVGTMAPRNYMDTINPGRGAASLRSYHITDDPNDPMNSYTR